MPENRQARLHGILGMTNTGKSWYVLNVLIPFHQKRFPEKKQVIVACEDHPDYSRYEIITAEMLSPKIWKNPKPGSVKRIIVNPSDLDQIDFTFKMMNEHLSNSIVYVEDAGSFFPDRLKTTPGIIAFNGSCKNQNRDCFYQFWNFGEIPKRMTSWFKTMVIFPVGDVYWDDKKQETIWDPQAKTKLGANFYKIRGPYEEVLKQKLAAEKLKLPVTDPRAHPKTVVIF